MNKYSERLTPQLFNGMFLQQREANKLATIGQPHGYCAFAGEELERKASPKATKSSSVSLQKKWGSSFVRLMSLGILLLFCFQSVGQQKKETIKVSDSIKKTAFSLKENVHHYVYQVEKEGDYKVLVLSPSGEIISRPVKQQHFLKAETIKVAINSKYWSAGLYRILIEKDLNTVATYQLKIASDKYKHQK